MAHTGFGPGLLTVVYYVLALPPAGLVLSLLLPLSKADHWAGIVGVLSVWGVFATLIAVPLGGGWVRKKEQELAQRHRDRRARQIHSLLTASARAPLLITDDVLAYCLYLRPFTSTGRVRIPLRSTIRKRSGLSATNTPTNIPGFGRTSLYKRYVRYGDFETILAGMVNFRAPLIALGRAAEQIGAGRIESDDVGWRDDFMLLAAHAQAIFLVPSTHEGTRWEIERLLGARELLRRTIFFVPPDELVLGADVGPHLQIGASPGPVGSATIREEAIEALQQFGKEISVSRIEKARWGALFQLRPNGRITNYRPLESREGFSLSPYTVGSSTGISMPHFSCTVEELLRLVA